MSLAGRLYRGETDFDFVGSRRRGFTFSAVLITISVAALLIRGLNLGVDFEGGVVVEVENVAEASVGDVRDALRPLGLDNAKVQLTSGGGTGTIRVETEVLDPETESALVVAISDTASVGLEDANVVSVGPTFGDEIARSAVQALVIFLIVVSIFISFRFEWKMAAAALAALVHDLLLTGGVYAVTGLEVTPATVIAVLTILGYSLYDTVVVFDKVLENVELAEERYSYTEIVNSSMNQVLMRSLNTSLTSLLPVGSLLFVGSFLLGATTLREFALALFVGVAAGTYSSIVIAAPLLSLAKEREPVWQEIAARSSSRPKPTRPGPTRPPKGEKVPKTAPSARQSSTEVVEQEAPKAKRSKKSAQAASEVDSEQPVEGPTRAAEGPSGAKPRPPKKRRRKR